MHAEIIMDEKVVSELLRSTAQGDFKLVYSRITSEGLQLHNNIAIKIIIECCRVFCRNESPVVDEEDLVKLLNTCQQFIKQLDDDVFLSYLQSLFFIAKFFFKQKRLGHLLGIRSLILPKLAICLENGNLVKTYTNICNVVHNAFIMGVRDEAAQNSQMLYQLCMLSLEMKSMYISSNIELATAACSYFKTPIFLKTDIDSQYNSYLHVLKLFKGPSETKAHTISTDGFSAVMKITDMVIRNLFKQKQFNKIKEFMDIAKLAIRRLSNKKIHLIMIDILHDSSQIIVPVEDVPNNAELLRNSLQKNLKSLLGNNFLEEFAKLFDLLHLLFSNLLDYYSTIDPTIWNTYMQEHTQIVICNYLGNAGKIISQIEGKCHCSSNCKVNKCLYSAAIITLLPANFFKICLAKSESVSTSVCCYVLRYLERSCEFIKTSYSYNCSEWKSAWLQVGIMVYNIAIKLYSWKNPECCSYFTLFVQNVTHFEETAKCSLSKTDVLGISLHCLCEMNISICQFEKALMYAAIAVLISANPKSYKTWVTTKAKSKESGLEDNCCLQQRTIACTLQQHENEIKALYPNLKLNLNTETVKNLVIGELVQYKTAWKSKIPMLYAFKKLYNITDLLTSVKVITQIWSDSMDCAHNDVIKLLNEIVCKFKLNCKKNMKNKDNSQETEEKFYLASLYTMQYYGYMKIIRQKFFDEMSSKVIPEQSSSPQMPKNQNDECDLVSSYTNLRLYEHLKTVRLLNKAIKLYNSYISDCAPSLVLETVKQQNLYDFVVKIGHEFRLHRDSLQAIQTWFLCLRIARLINNNAYILQSISFLLEETNKDTEIIKGLLTEAEALVKDLAELDSPEICTILTMYHTNKSKMLLRHLNVENGYKEYQLALECFQKLKQDKNELLGIRLDYLHVQYLLLPCSFKIDGHDVFSLAKILQTLSRITSYLKDGENNTDVMTTLFEIYLSVAHFYRRMCLPREIRCYCRDIVKYAQQMVIPFQTAHFLIYLAQADLLNVRLDDCQVKLNGLSDLLCLDNKRSISSCSDAFDNEAISNKNTDEQFLVENFAEMVLDCPSTGCKYKGPSGSPIMLIKPYTQPSFMRHSVDCDCFCCLSVEYKILVLEYINLEAQLHAFRRNNIAAQACFKGGLELYRHINNDVTFEPKIKKYLMCYPLYDWQYILCQSVCKLLLNYANSLLRAKDIQEAEVCNQQILDLLSCKRHDNSYLLKEAVFQKYIITTMKQEEKACVQNNLQASKEVSVSNDTKDTTKLPHTPKNKQTKILITCHSPRPNSPPKRRLRRIKCNFSDDDSLENKDEDDVKKGANLEKPFPMSYKTPAPSCSTTCIPSTIKTKNCDLLEMSSPIRKSTIQSEASINHCADSNVSSVIPSSPNAYTPNVLQASSNLKSRTALLTNKLKSSIVKKTLINDVHSDPSEEDNASNSRRIINRKVKDNVCKNLMSELSAAGSKANSKPSYKTKTGKYISAADTTKDQTNKVQTRRNTRSSKSVNK